VIAAVADDDTGATDLAGMLAGQGLRTVLLIDTPKSEDFDRWTSEQDAVIAGPATRALAPGEAYRLTREAVRLLRSLNPATVQIKYCSTFDSTREGNIGPSIDAALDEMGEEFTIAVPALPVNGRTTYLGHHFVDGRLLSESPMRRHPLTPMTDPDLVRHLQAQTARKVGLAPLGAVRGGAAALGACFGRLREEGVKVAVVDCTSDDDLEVICEAAAELKLITGSSAPAMKLPDVWRRRGLLSDDRTEARSPLGAASARGFLIVAGSCSEATRAQNEYAERHGARVFKLDAAALLEGGYGARFVSQAACALAAGETCLITTSATPDEVCRVQSAAPAHGLSVPELGLKIAYKLADLARAVIERQPPAGLIAAGGETAGALCRALELGALQVGRNIQPGVPLCHSLGAFRMPVVLKSGNFGTANFYEAAQERIISDAHI
jgi:uncharacterized protein YgbK (DUF1537 family)